MEVFFKTRGSLKKNQRKFLSDLQHVFLAFPVNEYGLLFRPDSDCSEKKSDRSF